MTTAEECREAARELRLPLGSSTHAATFGRFDGYWNWNNAPRNCYVWNTVWFNTDKRRAHSLGCGYNPGPYCSAICKDCAVKNIKRGGQKRYQVMGVSQGCRGIGTEVTTVEECREAARYVRIPLGNPFAGWWGQRGTQRNCLVNANRVWFNYDQRVAPSSGCRGGICVALCKISK